MTDNNLDKFIVSDTRVSDITGAVASLVEEIDYLKTQLADWRRLAMSLSRCEHGRIHGDVCSQCPNRTSPDQTGRVVGYSLDGAHEVAIPPRGSMHVVESWYRLSASTVEIAGGTDA